MRRGVHILENLTLEEPAQAGTPKFVVVRLPPKLVDWLPGSLGRAGPRPGYLGW